MGNIATIIVFENDSFNSMFDILFADAFMQRDVYKVVEKSFPDKGLYRYLQSRKLKRISFGQSERLYLRYYELSKKIKELSKSYDKFTVLFHNASLRRPAYPTSFFDFMRKSYRISFNVIYLDTYSKLRINQNSNKLVEQQVFDKVFTFDPQDAMLHKLILHSTPYSKVDIPSVNLDCEMYACGSGDRRTYLLYQIWKKARERNISVRYDMVWGKAVEDFFKGDSLILFHDTYIGYEEVLKSMMKSRCIIDLTSSDQTGLTLRPYEAVVYNKKLLTNNKSILKFKYYDPQFMHYFERVEDIDWDWVMDETDVDYHYQGDFSPALLIKEIE